MTTVIQQPRAARPLALFLAGLLTLSAAVPCAKAAVIQVKFSRPTDANAEPTDQYDASETYGGNVKYYDSSGSLVKGPVRGGEFLITQQDVANPLIFKTFCLERNENISLNTKYDATLPDYQGAVGGGPGGTPDPLSAESMWLYDAYREGILDTLGGTQTSTFGNFQYASDIWADVFQLTIWRLEEEIADFTGFAGYKISSSSGAPSLADYATEFYNWVINWDNNGGNYGIGADQVFVMNVWTLGHGDDNADITQIDPAWRKQSQLGWEDLDEAPPVPEPASLAVWGGLSFLGLVFGNRFRRKAA